MSLAGAVSAQFSATLTGYPLVTTGWILGGSSTAIDSTLRLTPPSMTQNGYVYYNTPTNLTTCGHFTVDYDYKIVVTPGTPVADGIAFWYLSNPPVTVTGGGGCGIPNNANGLILVLDTYDNNSAAGPDNPLITLLGYNGTIPSYVEGSTTGRLGTVATLQTYITDGTWHHVTVDYTSGNINVYVNYSTTPIITAYYPMSINGYFGFSSSTGLYYSDQRIKNVHVVSTAVSPLPTVVSPVNYCQGATATALTAGGTGPFYWFTTDTATVTSLPGAPVPSTATTGVTTYYVRQGSGTCMSPPDSIKVVVGTPPAAPVLTGHSPYCTGETFIPFVVTGATGSISWYTTPTGGTASSTPATVNTSVAGTTINWITQTVSGCESVRSSFTTVVHATPPAPTLTGTATYCQYQPYTALTATGTNILWYTTATGGTGSVTQPLINTSLSGTTTLYATQTDTGCESPRAAFTITVNPKPAKPVVTPPVYCQLDVAAPLVATGTNLLWYGPGITGGASATPIPSTAIARLDTYYVTQTVLGCTSDSARDIVTVKPKPAPPVTADTSYCQFFLAPQLTATGSNLLWYTSVGGTGSSTAPTPPTTTPGNTTWFVTQTVNGCISNAAPLTVTTIFLPVFTITQSRPYVCQFDTLTLSYTGGTPIGAGYTWTLPEGASFVGTAGNLPSVVVAFDSLYSQDVVLRIGDNANRCANYDTLRITVSPAPIVEPYIKENICLGDTVGLALSSRSDNAANYVWDFASANIITHSSNSGGPYTVSWSTPGVHVIKVTATTVAGCKSKTISDTVNVHKLPLATFRNISGGPLCLEDSVELRADSIISSNNYSWSPVHFFVENSKGDVWGRIETQGYVKLRVTDPFGCYASDSTLFNPDYCCTVSFPSAFTPNGDGKNDNFRPIYQGYHRFHNFRIINRWGQTVFESTNSNMSWDGNYNGVPQDMGVYYYFVKYDCGDKELIAKGDVTLIR